MHFLNILAFLNTPGEETGPNHRARAKAKLIIAVMYYFMQTFLMTELFEKHFHKILLIWFNGLILWLVFCFQLPYDGLATVSKNDIFTLFLCILATLMPCSLFAYVHKNIEKVVMSQ